MTSFRRKQLLGMAGALPAFVAVALTLEHAKGLFEFVVLPSSDLAARLAFAVHWMLLPGCCLLAGVIAAARRGFVPDAIDGTRTPQATVSRSICDTTRTRSNNSCSLASLGQASQSGSQAPN